MNLYRRDRRRCETCEYYFKRYRSSAKCYFNPPQISGEHNSGRFPSVDKDDFCSKWEPNWHENEQIREAWNQFVMVRKLIIGIEDEE